MVSDEDVPSIDLGMVVDARDKAEARVARSEKWGRRAAWVALALLLPVVALDRASGAVDACARALAVCCGGLGLLAMLLSMSLMDEKFASDGRCAKKLGISARQYRDILASRGSEIDAHARGQAAALAEREELASATAGDDRAAASIHGAPCMRRRAKSL